MDKTVEGKPKRFGFRVFTRVERGLFSYTVNPREDAESFQLADGEWRPYRNNKNQTGKARVSCTGSNTVLIEYIDDADGVHSFSKVTRIDDAHAEYESDLAERTGFYTKL